MSDFQLRPRWVGVINVCTQVPMPHSTPRSCPLAANTRWANTPPTARLRVTKPGLEAAHWARFKRQVDPEGKLSPADCPNLASNAPIAYCTGLVLKSLKARRIRKAAQHFSTPWPGNWTAIRWHRKSLMRRPGAASSRAVSTLTTD